MEDLSKIIKGLECCTSGRGAQSCFGCPYVFAEDTEDCQQKMMKDALEVIREVERERAGG